MAANKRGKAPLKASVKRMRRPSRLEALERGRVKMAMFFARIGVWVY
jgi:hypothetical protein